MNVLGISAFFHDSAAALVRDGTVIAAVEEERFSREKHTGRFPSQSIKYCLARGEIEPNELDYIAFNIEANPFWPLALKSFAKISKDFFAHHPRTVKKLLLSEFNKLFSDSKSQNNGWEVQSSLQAFFRLITWGNRIRNELELNKKNGPILLGIPHHLAHIGGSYLISDFNDSAIIIADQRGEWTTTTLAEGVRDKIRIINSISLPDSLGSYYGTITAFLGFRPLSGEGSVMGLSSYGKDKYSSQFSELLEISEDGLFALDSDVIDFTLAVVKQEFTPRLIEVLGNPRHPKDLLQERHANIAKSLQTRLDSAILSLSSYTRKRSSSKNLSLGGGIALNSVSNGNLSKLKSHWENIYVPSSPGDSGSALGAAVWVSHDKGKINISFNHPYVGPEFSPSSYIEAFEEFGLSFTEHKDVATNAAKLLADKKIIGWFQGRMEFGPRALGNRSILADPRDKKTGDRVNKLKGREPWRPLAPSILEEELMNWFEDSGRSPHMSFVKRVKSGKKNKIPACVHVDGTARPQTVSKISNLKYWNLINRFYLLTNVPCVLNTSFNMKGEPIVCNPKDGVKSFLNMQLDYLVMGNYIGKVRT